jgi:hypothetical protein
MIASIFLYCSNSFFLFVKKYFQNERIPFGNSWRYVIGFKSVNCEKKEAIRFGLYAEITTSFPCF